MKAGGLNIFSLYRKHTHTQTPGYNFGHSYQHKPLKTWNLVAWKTTSVTVSSSSTWFIQHLLAWPSKHWANPEWGLWLSWGIVALIDETSGKESSFLPQLLYCSSWFRSLFKPFHPGYAQQGYCWPCYSKDLGKIWAEVIVNVILSAEGCCYS